MKWFIFLLVLLISSSCFDKKSFSYDPNTLTSGCNGFVYVYNYTYLCSTLDSLERKDQKFYDLQWYYQNLLFDEKDGKIKLTIDKRIDFQDSIDIFKKERYINIGYYNMFKFMKSEIENRRIEAYGNRK